MGTDIHVKILYFRAVIFPISIFKFCMDLLWHIIHINYVILKQATLDCFHQIFHLKIYEEFVLDSIRHWFFFIDNWMILWYEVKLELAAKFIKNKNLKLLLDINLLAYHAISSLNICRWVIVKCSKCMHFHFIILKSACYHVYLFITLLIKFEFLCVHFNKLSHRCRFNSFKHIFK